MIPDDADKDEVKRITEKTVCLWDEMDRLGLAHWRPAVATLLNGYLGLEDFSEADFGDEGLDWLVDITAKLTPPLSDEQFVDILMRSPLLGWSVRLGERIWDPRQSTLDEFLGDDLARIHEELIVWQDPQGPQPTLDEIRTWLLAEARRVKDGPAG